MAGVQKHNKMEFQLIGKVTFGLSQAQKLTKLVTRCNTSPCPEGIRDHLARSFLQNFGQAEISSKRQAVGRFGHARSMSGSMGRAMRDPKPAQ